MPDAECGCLPATLTIDELLADPMTKSVLKADKLSEGKFRTMLKRVRRFLTKSGEKHREE